MAEDKPPVESPELAISSIIAKDNIREVDRKSPGFRELVASIVAHGVIEPLVVRPAEGGYELVAGFRRLAAAKEAKLLTVPVSVQTLDNLAVAEVRLLENLQREDLSPMEEGRAIDSYAKLTGAKPKEISEKLAKSESWVRDRIGLTTLPTGIQEILQSGRFSAEHGQALLYLPNDDEGHRAQAELAKQALQWRQSPSDLRQQARNLASEIEGRRRFQSELAKSEFPTCPTCKKRAAQYAPEYEGGKQFFRDEQGHRWSVKTGKAPKEVVQRVKRGVEKRIETVKVNRANNAEPPSLRSLHSPAVVLRELLKEVGDDRIFRLRWLPGMGDRHTALSVEFVGEEKLPLWVDDGPELHIFPAVYSTGHRAAVLVQSPDAADRKEFKRKYAAWEKENLPAPKEPKAKEAPLGEEEAAEILEGDMSKVVPKLAALTVSEDEEGDMVEDLAAPGVREKLEILREAELAGKARGGVIDRIDAELGIRLRGFYG